MKKLSLIVILLNVFLTLNLFAAKNLYISYKEKPSKVYTNQRFEIVVKALITTSNFDKLKTTFQDKKNINLLNPNAKWEKISADIYEARYIFKVIKANFKMPTIKVSLVKSNSIIDTSILSLANINYSNIAVKDNLYCGVIADDFVINTYKTKQYNNNSALTIIDVQGINSNLEEFHIKGIKEQGVSELKDKYLSQNLIYYFVTPVHKKKLVLNYYNTKTKSFKDIIIPLVLQNELVSTQTDLNPNDSSFEKYKKIAVVLAFILFLLLYLWKKKKFLLFLAVVFFILSVVYLIPNQTGVVKKGSYIYILPTKNSTIFFKLDSNEKVEKLQKRNGFIKVIGIDNNFIGWIKEDSFGKN